MNPPLDDDDRLAVMRHVDGELSPAEQAAFEARVVHEPALARAVARARRLREGLQSAYAPVLDEPMPGGLADLLAPPAAAANDPVAAGAGDVHRAALPHARRWRWPEWGAIAASLALGVLLGARGLAPPSSGAGPDTLALAVGHGGTITARGGLRDALEQRLAGTAAGGVAVGLSFRNQARQYCRTFSLDDASSGIACKQADDWVLAQLEHVPGAPASAAGAYRAAASPLSPTLLQAVDALRDGDTLDAAAEAAARARGWRP